MRNWRPWTVAVIILGVVGWVAWDLWVFFKAGDGPTISRVLLNWAERSWAFWTLTSHIFGWLLAHFFCPAARAGEPIDPWERAGRVFIVCVVTVIGIILGSLVVPQHPE